MSLDHPTNHIEANAIIISIIVLLGLQDLRRFSVQAPYNILNFRTETTMLILYCHPCPAELCASIFLSFEAGKCWLNFQFQMTKNIYWWKIHNLYNSIVWFDFLSIYHDLFVNFGDLLFCLIHDTFSQRHRRWPSNKPMYRVGWDLIRNKLDLPVNTIHLANVCLRIQFWTSCGLWLRI